MGEIKSTLELALERTRGMTLSDEEKQRLRDEKAEKRAKGLFLRFRQGLLRLTDLEAEAAKTDEASPELVRKYLSRQFLDTLAPDMDESVALDDLKAWFGEQSSAPLEDARVILEEYNSRCDELYSRAENRILRNLNKAGIGGSAVKPKVEQDAQYSEGLQKIREAAETKLKTVRERLVTLGG